MGWHTTSTGDRYYTTNCRYCGRETTHTTHTEQCSFCSSIYAKLEGMIYHYLRTGTTEKQIKEAVIKIIDEIVYKNVLAKLDKE